MASHCFADADLFCALRSLCRRQVDEVDTGQQQQEGSDGQQAIKSWFMRLAAFIENSIVEIEMNIVEWLKMGIHRGVTEWVGLFISQQHFGELSVDGCGFYPWSQTYEELVG